VHDVTGSRSSVAALALSLPLVLAACDAVASTATPPVVSPTAPVLQPGRPGEPNTSLTGTLAAPAPAKGTDPDDARFLQDMVVHHAQALQMVSVAKPLLTDPQVTAIAARIEDTQKPEIGAMTAWLKDHGAAVPPQSANPMFGAGSGHEAHRSMPGMATPAQMRELGAARGVQADLLFLSLMTAHHRGAISMVVEQHRTGRDDRAGELGDDIAATQSAEITHMTAMRARLQP
jgi:uncharacterized protein (DUF305 family)